MGGDNPGQQNNNERMFATSQVQISHREDETDNILQNRSNTQTQEAQ